MVRANAMSLRPARAPVGSGAVRTVAGRRCHKSVVCVQSGRRHIHAQ
jgi:hypothetical protein